MTTTSRKRRASETLESPSQSLKSITSTSPQSRTLRYTFDPLLHANEIRLLRVAKSSADETWEYSIEHHVLHKAPPFETVSYVWGDATRACELNLGSIGVNGKFKTMLINSNLAEAIPWLSWHCRTGYLWIDQICINQTIINERNHQVKIMGDIYRHGERVLVWLRDIPIDGYLIELIDICKASSKKRETVHLLQEKLIKSFKQPDVAEAHGALIRIFRNEWFTRAWVFQEIAMSKSADFVVRNHALSLESLRIIAKTALSEQSPWSLRHALRQDSSWNTLREMYETRWRLAHGRRRDVYGLNFSDFRRLLSNLASSMQATDVRDRIYAFSGFEVFSDFDWSKRITITANYALPFRQVLIQAAVSMIRESETLDILGNACTDWTPGNSQANVPSWVPIWNKISKLRKLYVQRSNTPSTLGSWRADDSSVHHEWFDRTVKHVWLESGSTLKLYVRGTCITTIADVFSPRFRYLSSQRLCPVNDLYQYINLDTRIETIHAKLGNSFITRETLLEVIMADRANSEGLEGLPGSAWPRMKELLEGYDQLENPKSQSSAPLYNELLVSRIQAFTHFAHGRKIFHTTNYLLGLASGSMPGDQIFILRGCQTPVILRHVSGKEYRFVETCYLRGAMFGEMVTWDWDDADDILLV
ncbi:hypothetical protein BU16DRAFT_527545 [Lophium mytilinum]|uniref:Heterokaryon incompatibility domain-containing protein n=1 Tax=Lophium mytilinum TaxID=390894 RepID=A0A6A6QPV1_9PEZI|nr:hypothetical protein BU16DRAFT_527545 [Lophium mytilinum]